MNGLAHQASIHLYPLHKYLVPGRGNLYEKPPGPVSRRTGQRILSGKGIGQLTDPAAADGGSLIKGIALPLLFLRQNLKALHPLAPGNVLPQHHISAACVRVL